MLSLISKKLIHILLKDEIIDRTNIELYQYGIELLVSSFLNILWIIGIGIIIQEIFLAVVYILILATVRTQIGGYHADTYEKCFVCYTVVFAGIFLVADIFMIMKLSASILAVWSGAFLIMEYIYAPTTRHKKLNAVQMCKAKKRGMCRTIVWMIVMFGCLKVYPKW